MTIAKLFAAGQYAEAVAAFELCVRPMGHDDVVCYSRSLEMLGRYQDAASVAKQLHTEATRRTATDYVSTLCRLGLRDHEWIDRAISYVPGNDFLKAAKSEMALNDGDYQTGFSLCQYRWAATKSSRFSERVNLPYWEGQPLTGRLIVAGEQGIGEEILCASSFGLIPPAIISADQRLHPMLSRSFPQHVFVERTTLHHYAGEAVVEAFDLFRLFGRTGNDDAWLRVDDAKASACRTALNQALPGKKLVGLSWASSRKGLSDSKTIPVADLKPLLTDTSLACINLQYGDARADCDEIEGYGGELMGVEGLDLTYDLEGVFTLISALDVVVTCSNSVAHMAGALGKRTILLAPGGRFVLWYWGADGDRTPWYPSVEILRGPPRKGWAELAEQVRGMIWTQESAAERSQ